MKSNRKYKIKVLAEYIVMMRNHYNDTTDELMKKLIMDGVRCNTFYQSQTKDFWTGMITKNAKRTGDKIKEHRRGLKNVATEVLTSDLTKTEIQKYIRKNATWNYTTKEENQILKSNNQDYSKISELIWEIK